MAKVYPVTAQAQGDSPKHYSPEFQTAQQYASGWKALLVKMRQSGELSCGCPGQGEKRLAIRRNESDSFFLARYPLTGHEHATDCRFYAPNPMRSGLSGYQKGVLEEGPNGGVKIRLGIGLKKGAAGTEGDTPTIDRAPAGTPRASKTAMGLLGLLHFMWDQADLNTWWPAMNGKRHPGLINSKLHEAASNISAGRIKLANVLLLADNHPKGRWATHNQEQVKRAIKSGTRMIAIVPLAQFSPERSKEMGTGLRIAGFNGVPGLDMPSGLWERTLKRFPRAIAAWEKQHRTLAIVELDLKKDGKYANVLDLALMPVSANWIPFDSLHELRIIDKLTAEDRGFVKPLRFDADEDVVFPDFILLDMGTDTPMEVFGRTDEAYEARKAIKMVYYQEVFGIDGWWWWNAAADPDGENIPPFPTAGEANS